MKKNLLLLFGISMILTWSSCKSQKASDDQQPDWTNSLSYYSHSIAAGGYGYVFQITLEPDTLDQVFSFDSLRIAGVNLLVSKSVRESDNSLLLEAHYRYMTEAGPEPETNPKRIGEEEILADPTPLLHYHDKNNQLYHYPLNRAKAAGGPSTSP